MRSDPQKLLDDLFPSPTIHLRQPEGSLKGAPQEFGVIRHERDDFARWDWWLVVKCWGEVRIISAEKDQKKCVRAKWSEVERK